MKLKFAKCHLFDKKELVIDDLNFTEIISLSTDGGPGADHYERDLVKCIKCGAFFIREFIEWWNFDTGNDDMVVNYYPVPESHYQAINRLSWIEIKEYKPHINYSDKPKWVI